MWEIIYPSFGARLRRAREAAHLSQAHLGELIGLKSSSISNIEAGRQRVLLHQAVALAGAVDCPLDELLPAETLQPQVPVAMNATDWKTGVGPRARAWIRRRRHQPHEQGGE